MNHRFPTRSDQDVERLGDEVAEETYQRNPKEASLENLRDVLASLPMPTSTSVNPGLSFLLSRLTDLVSVLYIPISSHPSSYLFYESLPLPARATLLLAVTVWTLCEHPDSSHPISKTVNIENSLRLITSKNDSDTTTEASTSNTISTSSASPLIDFTIVEEASPLNASSTSSATYTSPTPPVIDLTKSTLHHSKAFEDEHLTAKQKSDFWTWEMEGMKDGQQYKGTVLELAEFPELAEIISEAYKTATQALQEHRHL